MRGRLNPALVYWLQVWGTESSRRIGLEYPGTTPEGKLLSSPGRGGNVRRSPSYEPNNIAIAVERAIEAIDQGEGYLLGRKYKDGASERIIGLFLGIPKGRVIWQMEKAHRNIAKELNMPVYR